MSKHADNVAGLTPKELAAAVGDMDYSAVEQFLRALSTKLMQDSHADAGRNRLRLASWLDHTARHLNDATTTMQQAALICQSRE